MHRWALVSLLLLCAVPGFGQTKPGKIRVRGSDGMLAFGQRLTQWYEKKNPAASFAVSGGGPDSAIAALVEGQAEIAQSPRRVFNSERDALRARQHKEFVEIAVATEAAGIVVNAANPVRELSLYQLRQVLSGAVKNWKQVGGHDAPIKVYGRDDSSGLRSFLEDEFMGDASIASSSTFATNAALLAAVGRDPGALGYGSVELRGGGTVRFLAIKASAAAEAIAPSGENIRAHRYKLTRPLYFCIAGRPAAELLRFAEWVLSPEGQLVVEAVEFYPLGPADREEGRARLGK